MQRSKKYSVGKNNAERTKAILRQNTTQTEDGSEERVDNESGAIKGRASNESVGPIDRSMYAQSGGFWSLEKFGAFASIVVIVVGAVWYFAGQDSVVKNLVDDSKDSKKKIDEINLHVVESRTRITNVEQKLNSLERNERSAWENQRNPHRR